MRVARAINRRLGTRCASSFVVDNPYTGEVHGEWGLSSTAAARELVARSAAAQRAWYGETSLGERVAVCERLIEVFTAAESDVAADISGSMGKPVAHAKGEINGMFERIEAMMALAPEALAPDVLAEKPGFERQIVKEPVGVVFVIAPWNYPLLTAVNAIVPAILAGNSVVLKHSPRTPGVADAFERAFAAAGAPAGLVSALHCDHDVTNAVCADERVGFVSFTGSVDGGHAVAQAVARTRFINTTLELGGKDPMYIAADANMAHAVESAVEGATWNAGQSCCAVERAYVHRAIYDEFVERAAAQFAASLAIGDPALATTSLGPMAQSPAQAFLESQVAEAVAKGARIVSGSGTAISDPLSGTGRFFSPTLVADCTNEMAIMQEESFGPLLGVMAVDGDDEALKCMNDSAFGLTASIFTEDGERAARMAPALECGTVFQNRCDYLDPELAWGGVKNSGTGVSLSKHGFHGVTKLKNFHFRTL